MNLREFLAVLLGREGAPVGAAFPGMLDLVSETFQEVDTALWSEGISEPLREDVYARDVRINQLERSIRRDVVAHLAVGHTADVAFCFVLVNVVKDAERIGDYAKNMLDPVVDPAAAPAGELRTAVRSMGHEVGRLLERVRPVFEDSDGTEAEALIRHGRILAARCDSLVREAAAAQLPSDATTALVLLGRFYKRISAHATNILSAVVMPVHKIDYFDEEALDRAAHEIE